MKKLFIIPAVAMLVCCTAGNKNNVVTLGSLLDEMVDIRAMAEWPALEYKCLQQSSYDRSSVSPAEDGWFANNDGFGFMRTEHNHGRTEKVLFEDNGPGAITRIWITTNNLAGTLRFYFDGADEAGWIIPAYDLTEFGISALGEGLLQPHTSYVPGGKGGSNLYLPIPYAAGCKVTLQEPDGAGTIPRYYQFNYRKYPEGTAVETFGIETVEKYKKQIIRTDHALREPAGTKKYEAAKSATLTAGDTLSLTLPAGSRVVDELAINVSVGDADYQQTMREIVISAIFDGKNTVWAPVSDFSGGGMGASEASSRMARSDGKGGIVSWWPMPYSQTGSIEIINFSDVPCEVSVNASVAKYKWTGRSLYFHTTWKQENALPIHRHTEECYDWNFVTLDGRGIYRGDVLSLFNHCLAWYGEGDEKIYVDGEGFPSHFGTGTEDYYNSSWAPVVPFHTPFGGAPRADLENSQGYNTFYRTRHLDAIPFEKSLVFDIEMLGWVDGTADYATTVFWYGDRDASARSGAEAAQLRYTLPAAPPDPAKYKVENAIEFEKLESAAKSTHIMTDRQNMAGFPEGKWSERRQLICFGGMPGDYVEFVIPGLTAAAYDMTIYATKATDYGIIEFTVNGRSLRSFDSFDNIVTDSGPIELGMVRPVDGKLTINVKITGKNELSNGYMFGLDCLTLLEK